MAVDMKQSRAVVPYLRQFNDEEKQLIAMLLRQVAPKATTEEKALFLYTAQKKGLDPFDKQIYLVPRWDSKLGREVHAVQVSIDGLRLMAQRSGKYAGQTPYYWCGPDGVWKDVWLDDETMPVAARVGIYRHDFKEPLYSVARFSDYKQTKKDGSLNHFWKTYGPHMIAKCCEALCIRRAFPEETSGFYIPEEMGNPEIVYVAETEQDNDAPIVASEVVNDAPVERSEAPTPSQSNGNGNHATDTAKPTAERPTALTWQALKKAGNFANVQDFLKFAAKALKVDSLDYKDLNNLTQGELADIQKAMQQAA
jgi:phage recombination protein Bet